MSAGTPAGGRLEGDLEDRVRSCIRQIHDPCSVATGHPLELEEMGLVREVRSEDDGRRVIVDLRLTSPSCVMVGFFVTEIEKLVHDQVDPEIDVEVNFDTGFEWTPGMMSPRVRKARADRFSLKG